MKIIRMISLGGLAVVVLIGVIIAFLAIRHLQTAAQVERVWQTSQVSPVPNLGSTRSLEIIPLVEEMARDTSFQSEHGVSYLIKTDTATILFDVGQNARAADPSPLEATMQSLGISLADIDTVVISHNHPDHTGGMKWWRAGTFSLGNKQPDLSGMNVYVPTPLSYPGLTPVVAVEPIKIAEGVATLGTIPFAEVWQLALFNAQNVEQALAIEVEGRGIVIISGCGHQTLTKLLDRTRVLFTEPVVGIVGGLHYETAGAEAVGPDVRLLQDLPLAVLALSTHDSEAAARLAFREAFPNVYQDVRVAVPIHFTSTVSQPETVTHP